jgi:hypothetical protein
VRKKLELAKKFAEAKWLSLNEADRRREQAGTDEIAAELKRIALAKAVQMSPAHYITLADIDSTRLQPIRKPAETPAAIANVEEVNPDEDIELSEAENILADYIHALLQAPSGVPAAARESKDPTSDQKSARQD